MIIKHSDHYVGEAGLSYHAERFGDRQALGRMWQSRYFHPWCSVDKVVLDFGCGDGVLLSQLQARHKFAVEVNEHCDSDIVKNNAYWLGRLEVCRTTAEVASGSVDVVISNHSLEHVLEPLQVLGELLRTMKKSGTLVLVTPFDDWRRGGYRTFRPDDRDRHLYTWSPQNLGNLLVQSGFAVESVRISHTAWSPRLFWVRRYLGAIAWRLSCRLLATIKSSREVVAIARKP